MGIQIGALHVRRSTLIQATPERVWEEFTSFERLGGDVDSELQSYESGWNSRHLEALKAIVDSDK
jgi:hypothetical protein